MKNKKKDTYFNIFQGNSLIRNTIAKSLGYEMPQKFTWFSEDMYFETFFYLTKRFGQSANNFDDDKEAARWNFKVKQYKISISLNSSWVEVMMYVKSNGKNPMGKTYFENYSHRSPYRMAYWRKQVLLKNKLIPEYSIPDNKAQLKIRDEQWDIFCKTTPLTENDKHEDISKAWFEHVSEYNKSIMNIDPKDYDKYGADYMNSKTKHAIRTLEQFLHNMLTPIWVRDCRFNIKGRCENEYDKYINNIKIELEK